VAIAVSLRAFRAEGAAAGAEAPMAAEVAFPEAA
jgi:hypothetical protein